MKTYEIKITGSKYNDNYFFFAPKDGEIEEEVAAIMKEMKAGNISRFTVEEVAKMTALEKRYQVAIDKIGHARLLNLPEQIKELLKNTKDLKTKTELLEEIAKNI